MVRAVSAAVLLALCAPAAALEGNCTAAATCGACTRHSTCGWITVDDDATGASHARCVAGDSYGRLVAGVDLKGTPLGGCLGTDCSYQYASCATGSAAMAPHVFWTIVWLMCVPGAMVLVLAGYRYYPLVSHMTLGGVVYVVLSAGASNLRYIVGGGGAVAFGMTVCVGVMSISAGVWSHLSCAGAKHAGHRVYSTSRRVVGAVAATFASALLATYPFPIQGGRPLVSLCPYRATAVVLVIASATLGFKLLKGLQRGRLILSSAFLGSYLLAFSVDRTLLYVAEHNTRFADAQTAFFLMLATPHGYDDFAAVTWTWEAHMYAVLLVIFVCFGCAVHQWCTCPPGGQRHLSAVEARAAALEMPIDDVNFNHLRRRDPVTGSLVEMTTRHTGLRGDNGAGGDGEDCVELPSPDANARRRAREEAMYRDAGEASRPSLWERLRWKLGLGKSAGYSPLVITKTRPRGASAIDVENVITTYEEEAGTPTSSSRRGSTAALGGHDDSEDALASSSEGAVGSRLRSRRRRHRGDEGEHERVDDVDASAALLNGTPAVRGVRCDSTPQQRKGSRGRSKSAKRDAKDTPKSEGKKRKKDKDKDKERRGGSKRRARSSTVDGGGDGAAPQAGSAEAAANAAWGAGEVWATAAAASPAASSYTHSLSASPAAAAAMELSSSSSSSENDLFVKRKYGRSSSRASSSSPVARTRPTHYAIGAAVDVAYYEASGAQTWYPAVVLGVDRAGNGMTYTVKYATGELCYGVEEDFLRPAQ